MEKIKTGWPDDEVTGNAGLHKNTAGLHCDFQLLAF
jgi:hypothetical protein